MTSTPRPEESLKEILISSTRSTGFWSAVAAIVGVIALAAGGIIQLTVDELSNFSITVLIIGGSLLFLALILSPRAIAIFLIGRQGRYGVNVAIMTVAFFAIAVLINFLMFRNTSRFDLTATRVFTLSPQTIRILEDLDSPVRANAFFVPQDTRTAIAQQLAEDLLNEFSRRSGNFDYRFVDPELNKSVAVNYNVTQYPTVVFEDLLEGTQQGVFSFTEQEFVTGILVSTGVQQKVVYHLTGHNEAAATRDPFTSEPDDNGLDFALEGMRRDNYQVVPLNLSQIGDVPSDAAALVIAGPKDDMTIDERAALHEYLLSGGNVVALLDPDTPDSFVELIVQWGVIVGRHSIADAVSNVAGEELTPMVQKANGQYGTSKTIGIGIADELDVTFFPEVTFVEPALPIEDMPPHITTFPLALTTPASWVETNTEEISFSPGEDLLGPWRIATVVQVRVPVSEDHTELADPVAKLVVIGDSDFARNKFFFSSDNADLLLNSVNWLSEDYELISIRPKVAPYRQLIVNTRERDFIQWSSWLLPPSIMIILGVFVWWRRR